MSVNSAWILASPVTSGWNEVASRWRCRTATILPVAGPVATVATTSHLGADLVDPGRPDEHRVERRVEVGDG